MIDIYNERYLEGWSLLGFDYLLRNAAEWVAYYNPTRSIFKAIARRENEFADEGNQILPIMIKFSPRHCLKFVRVRGELKFGILI